MWLNPPLVIARRCFSARHDLDMDQAPYRGIARSVAGACLLQQDLLPSGSAAAVHWPARLVEPHAIQLLQGRVRAVQGGRPAAANRCPDGLPQGRRQRQGLGRPVGVAVDGKGASEPTTSMCSLILEIFWASMWNPPGVGGGGRSTQAPRPRSCTPRSPASGCPKAAQFEQCWSIIPRLRCGRSRSPSCSCPVRGHSCASYGWLTQARHTGQERLS